MCACVFVFVCARACVSREDEGLAVGQGSQADGVSQVLGRRDGDSHVPLHTHTHTHTLTLTLTHTHTHACTQRHMQQQ